MNMSDSYASGEDMTDLDASDLEMSGFGLPRENAGLLRIKAAILPSLGINPTSDEAKILKRAIRAFLARTRFSGHLGSTLVNWKRDKAPLYELARQFCDIFGFTHWPDRPDSRGNTLRQRKLNYSDDKTQ
jgi:hypothetical protein